eukprot:gene10612-12284_t
MIKSLCVDGIEGGHEIKAVTCAGRLYVFDYKSDDVYWCTADCGWITGHTYVTYGPLLCGATQVLFEGVPTCRNSGRFLRWSDKYKLLTTAPTAIRALCANGDALVTKHSRKSLRLLGTVGEPINPEAWKWYHEVVGDKRCPIMDTWWQTETGAHMITPLPGVHALKPGSATLPFFGVEPCLLDDKGNEVEGVGEGYLMIKRPWPSMLRTVAGDHARFESTYFSFHKGMYFTGDGAKRDAAGYYWIIGRDGAKRDAEGHYWIIGRPLLDHRPCGNVINVSGHRIGTAEVESALKELIDAVRKTIGAFAAPDAIQYAPGLPKTRSGKIMRRVLRKIANREEDSLGDTSTLADPTVVQSLIQHRDSM